MIQIVNYQPSHASAFKELNAAWINKYFEMEESDRKMLDDPQGYILDKGGAILIALMDEKPIGTCALIKMEEEVYELAKMAVSPEAQGQKIGWKIGLATIEKAKELGANRVYLETNSVLKPAISLYRKLGFKDTEGYCSPYARCNVQMELIL
ncbi:MULTISPECIES: GNAT family N-acetyltransferase [unclassified Ekhidna]|jgi:GNAT superfamily N-acetyltransferase|uniref:GNAT family N-acetyltransferase n=1 Tax=unclassified Ekhidna TaxID=2632188 RepID=UPI0032DF03DF